MHLESKNCTPVVRSIQLGQSIVVLTDRKIFVSVLLLTLPEVSACFSPILDGARCGPPTLYTKAILHMVLLDRFAFSVLAKPSLFSWTKDKE